MKTIGTLLGVAAVLVACGSSSSSSSGPTIRDAAGHTCHELGDQQLSCDADPKPSTACTGGAKACWLVTAHLDPSSPALSVCAGCCNGSTGSTNAVDCTRTSCGSDSDCPTQPPSRCVGGRCQ